MAPFWVFGCGQAPCTGGSDPKMLGRAANALVRTLFEPACAACTMRLPRPLAGPVCETCWAAIPRLTAPLCAICGDPLTAVMAAYALCNRCLANPPAFDAARSVGLHAGSLRAIIHAFKYGGRRTLAAPLAALMRQAGAELLASADLVVPVPLHPWRAMHRGFNQADDLARHLGRKVYQPLRRLRHALPQASLGGEARRESVRQAFGPRGVLWGIAWDRAAAGRLCDRHVLLVDDVMTTGATLAACARVLREAGAAGVAALTVARVPAPPPGSRPRGPHPSNPLRQ